MLICPGLQIVAGLEAENTNLFLQMLGTAARMGTAADAVQVGIQGTLRTDDHVLVSAAITCCSDAAVPSGLSCCMAAY
jgi:hypothetical protein